MFEEGCKDSDKLNSVGLYIQPSKFKIYLLCTLNDQATELVMLPFVENLKSYCDEKCKVDTRHPERNSFRCCGRVSAYAPPSKESPLGMMVRLSAAERGS